jgi:ammonia channel protein AmtB
VRKNGLFYKGTWNLIGVQLLAIVVFISWSGIINGAYLIFLKALGWLRVPIADEVAGIDVNHCKTLFIKFRRR